MRLAGHDFLDFRINDDDTTSGGSNGCIRLDDTDNAGLARCTNSIGIQDIYENWCDQVSLADFIVIAAEALMARTATEHDERDRWAKNSLSVMFRDGFKFGRETADECDWEGLMPDAEQGCNTVKDIMVDHMFGDLDSKTGFEAAATIMGTHTLGSASTRNSGYQGHWSDRDNQGIFNNNYYRSIIMKGWGPEFSVGGREDRNQWKRIDAMAGETDEMMLTSDMCLMFDDNSNFRDCIAEGGTIASCNEHVGEVGENVYLAPLETECCAWHFAVPLYDEYAVLLSDVEYEDFCGISILNEHLSDGDEDDDEEDDETSDEDEDEDEDADEDGELDSESSMERVCCAAASEDSVGDCSFSGNPKGEAADIVRRFAADEDYFLEVFVKRWEQATGNGYDDL